MPKNRKHTPQHIRYKVLQEFNHRCAICGADQPHKHHIDKDPSNNDPMNLIPLCPNHHLIDQHDPTKPTEPEKLGLFRKFKNHSILKPQFHPLYVRLQQFFDSIENCSSNVKELENKARELIDFIKGFEMGSFYAVKIEQLIKARTAVKLIGDANSGYHYQLRAIDIAKDINEYHEQLRKARDQVYSLAIELLRYQPWGQ